MPEQKNQVNVVGRPGQPFTIEGSGFGGGGQLLIAGRAITTTRWNDTSIKGQLPTDLPAEGDVVLTPSGGDALYGSWPASKVSPLAGGQVVTVRTQDGSLVQGVLVGGSEPVGGTARVSGAGVAQNNVLPAGPDKNPPAGSIANPAPQQEGAAKTDSKQGPGGGAPTGDPKNNIAGQGGTSSSTGTTGAPAGTTPAK